MADHKKSVREACWKGWVKRGMKKKGNRTVPNCVKEENTPTNPGLWSRVKAQAKKKFDVYPSAYANAWLVRTYKKRGGRYRS